MNSSPQRRTVNLSLNLAAAGAAPTQELARILYGHGGSTMPLPVLSGTLEGESWHTQGPVRRGRLGVIDYAASPQICYGALRLDDAAADPADTTEQAYTQVHELQQALGFPHLLRVWHCLDAINAGEGDQERYKRFCAGRARALARQVRPPSLPAATVIGTDQPGLHVHFLLAREIPRAFENPRQISAWRYPRQYGPARPAFARAVLVDWPTGTSQLFVSGTASIVGHATRHTGDAAAQLHESLANVETLLAEAGPGFAGAGLAGVDLLKVYLRQPADLAQVEAALAARIPPALPWVCLRADLCRRDLLVEVETQATRVSGGL